MGKPTGFLEYERTVNPSASPDERIKNYTEFHEPMDDEERREQAARCMNCGVPFCQSAVSIGGMVTGCPLHNLVPEWNDEVYHGNWEQALARLKKTNNFPEFTGRVCPALCEAACTCGLYDNPVTVRENELAIIEKGFESGVVGPRPPQQRTSKKVAIIGSGPSGLACADQLNHRGHNVTVYEKDDRPGGLLMYGIPNMKLDKKIVQRRIDIMEKEGVVFETGVDATDKKIAKSIMENFDAAVICCGAKNPRDLKMPGRDADGICFAVDFLKATTKSLLDSELADGNYISAEDKDVIIVGGGDTGNDCVGTCIRQGCKSVTQIEMLPKAPDERADDNPWPRWPKVCKTDYGQEEAIQCFGSDPRIYETTIKEVHADDLGRVHEVVTVNLTDKHEETMPCDLLIIAAGFLGPSETIKKAFDLKVTERSNIATEAGSYMTSVEKVFAAGDGRRGQSLVVWAIFEGRESAKEVDNYLMGYTNMI